MSDEVTTVPAWNSTDAIQTAIQQYQAQTQGAKEHLVALRAQVTEAEDVIKMLAGAIAALDQLLQNGKDESRPPQG
jgi:chromosome segregation ATPase